ncbi:tail fiber protein [Paenibacillus taichungensis]|uniref:tail fiber protein n=1 Tax=Paenibacillus taichungensis TaxID=484184 RepID=UPI0039A20BDB
MANRYANLEGSKKISEDFGNINVGFDRVQAEMDTKGTPADAQAKADAAKAAAIAAAAADLAAHKARGADEHPTAKGNAAGFMSAADKLKSDASTNAATPDTLMQRDAEGRAKVAAPAAADDIARKAETDAVQTKLDSHAADTVKHVTQAEHDKLNGVAAGAEVNQNAFSKINDVLASDPSDTITFVEGTGIRVTTDPENKRISITATSEAIPGPHALSHIQGGADVIPDAVTGGLSGLMSGADAKFVRQDGETKTGAQAKADAAEQAANEYTDQKVGEIVIDDASLTDKGIVQLSKSTTGDRDTLAATESAVGAVQQQVGNLANLQTTDKSNLVGAVNEVFQSGSEWKGDIADAITAKGVPTSATDSRTTFVSNIDSIETATTINGQAKREVSYMENISANDPIYGISKVGSLVDTPDKPTASYSRCVTYSKDGKYMAIGVSASPYVAIYKITDGLYTRLPDPVALPTGDAYSVAFSPDGVYLVVGHANAPYITIYKRSGDTFAKMANPDVLPTGIGLATTFSPDSVYLVVGHSNLPLLTVYKRSGDTFTKITVTGHPSTVYGADFSPDGLYLALAHLSSPFVTILKRSGDTFTKLANPAVLPTGDAAAVRFSPDGTLLAVGHAGVPYITSYSRAGDVFTFVPYPVVRPTQRTNSIAFSPDGFMMALAANSAPYIIVYKISGGVFNKKDNPENLPGNGANGIDFNSDGSNLALVFGGGANLFVYDLDIQAYKSGNRIGDVPLAEKLGYALETGVAGDKKEAVLIWR